MGACLPLHFVRASSAHLVSSRFVRAVLVLASACLAAACSSESPAGAEVKTVVHLPSSPSASAFGNGASVPSWDSGSFRQQHPDGSPLCNAVSWSGCYPDDPSTSNAQECNLAPDGGPYDPAGGYDKAQLACRVRRAANEPGVTPVCAPAGTLTAGMHCGSSDDCAAGYECVGDGICRSYCCSGQCSNGNEFCDIEATTTDPMLRVPVCAPTRACNLLDGQCGATETCAVVGEDGATSCVAIGSAHAGDGCDTRQCGRGLVCLGQSGSRNCYILCHVASENTECASTPKQKCKGGLPLFPTPGIGICH
jgi:hypothetical protein